MELSQQIVLDPLQHRECASFFLKHYQLFPKQPDWDLLLRIIDQFARIPYENISKIIKLSQEWKSGIKIRLPEQVIDDHIRKKLGGTCFSLTYTLLSILTTCGYVCYPVMAHMRAGDNIHCGFVVIFGEAKYWVDPGYLLNQPMVLEKFTRRHYQREFGGVELQYDPDTGFYNLFTFDRKEIKWRYRFQDRPCPLEEFLEHWLASFTKPMMHGICLTKITKSGIIYIHKQFMRQTTAQGKQNFKLKTNYYETIHSLFGIEKQTIEWAQAALDANFKKEVELGLFVPRKTRKS
jgi:arylamine N-acetyltransferase